MDELKELEQSLNEAPAFKELERNLNKSPETAGKWRVTVRFPNLEEQEKQEEYLDEWYNDNEQFINDYEDRKSLEDEFDIQMDDSKWESQVSFSNDDGALSNMTLEEAADIKDTSPNNICEAKTIYDEFKDGCYEALRSLQEMGAWGGWKVAEMVSGSDIKFDPMKDTVGYGFNQGQTSESETTGGGIAKVAGQAITGLVLGHGITKLAGGAIKSIPIMADALKAFGKNAWGEKLITLTVDAAKGFVSDTISFNANEQNLMDMLKEMGLPTVESIAKNEDNSFWTKKVKNGVDGIMAGVIISFIGGMAKLTWKALPIEAKMAGAVSGGVDYAAKKLTEEGADNE